MKIKLKLAVYPLTFRLFVETTLKIYEHFKLSSMVDKQYAALYQDFEITL